MSVKIDASGRRSVQSEAVVPGTPEQVWQAIATGPGVSSWFVPCKSDEGVGGEITVSFGPGMESTSKITSWNPPHSLSAEGSEIDPGAPIMATEWTVEAQAGGTCLVRVVHSWFAETDEWDGQFESTELGWAAFFRDLALYLAHFSGQPSDTFQMMAMSPEPQDATWRKLSTGLGFNGKAVGDNVHSPTGAPRLGGEIKHVGTDDHPEAVVLLNQPSPGIAHFFAMPMGGMVCVSIRTFFYGERAAEAVSKEESSWEAWVAGTFPMPDSANA